MSSAYTPANVRSSVDELDLIYRDAATKNELSAAFEKERSRLVCL